MSQVSAGGLGKVLDQMLREHPQVRVGGSVREEGPVARRVLGF